MNETRLTLGSLFSGSGGFELAGIAAGITPVWASEVEPFPILVTRKRLPQVKHYGDVSTLKGSELEPVDIITFGSPCFPEGTLILTEDGFLPIEEVEVGMKVLTHMGRWREVTATGAKVGETVLLKGNHYGLECTPNHPIYSARMKKYYPQLGGGKRGNVRYVSPEKEWTPASGMSGRLWAVPNAFEPLPIPRPTHDGSRNLKGLPPFNEDFFYLVGRWVGDGWVRDGQRSGRPEGEKSGTIIICAGYAKEEKLKDAVEKVADHYCVERCRTAVKYKFTSLLLSEWLTENFGKYAYGKRIPPWAFSMPESWRKALLQGILDTDGHRASETCFRITTVSKQLAYGMRLLGESLGYSTAVYHVAVPRTCVIEGRTVNRRDQYVAQLVIPSKRGRLTDGPHSWYHVRGVEPAGQAKVVYNLTVEEDNSYVADSIVVHNCQDLSVAGKRAGIHGGERSSLFFQAIRIIKEMREATNGKYPRYCVWENVPGAFSSNGGDDFKAVLEAVIGVKEEGVQVPPPEDHRWPKADVYLGDGWSVAYRVLDAQYWSVPQRRARIFLVADFAGRSAPEVLFKSESVSGYTPQGIFPWQRAAGGAENGVGEAGWRPDTGSRTDRDGVTYCMNPQGNSGIGITEDKTLALVAQDHGNHPSVMQAAGFCTEHSAQARGIGYEEEKSPTLRAGVVPAAMLFDNHAQDCRYSGPLEESPTVAARFGTGGNNQPLVAEPEPVTMKVRCGKEGGGKGPLLQHDKSATLATNNDQTVFVPFIKGARPHSAGEAPEWKEGETANTLNTFDTGEQRCNELAVRAFGVCSKQSHAMLSDNPHSGFYEADTARTLDQNGGRPDCSQGGICVVAPAPETYDVRFTSEGTKNARGHCYKTDVSRCLDTSEANPDSNHGGIAVVEPPVQGGASVHGPVACVDQGGGKPNCTVNEDAAPPLACTHGGAPVVAFTQNQRSEVRDLGDHSGCLPAQPGMKQQTYVLQGSMIGRDDKNGPQGSGINEDVSFTLDTNDRHAVAYCMTTGEYTQVLEEQSPTLMARDYKDPPVTNGVPCEEPVYIVRRLTPVECARLQGFPDWWCSDLAIPDPSEEEMDFWKEVFETHRRVVSHAKKPKTEKQIRKWLAAPYTDSAEYKLWGNGLCVNVAAFVLCGIAWAANKNDTGGE